MTAWSRAGSSYVCECRPGYEAVVELSGACAYAAPWGTVERAEGAVLTVVEQATGLAVAKRLRIAGATSPGDVDDVARRVSDARIGEEAAKAEDLATRGWHLDGPAGILSVAARGSRAAAEHPLSLGRLGGAPGGRALLRRRLGRRGRLRGVLAPGRRPRLGRRGIGPLPDAVRGARAPRRTARRSGNAGGGRRGRRPRTLREALRRRHGNL